MQCEILEENERLRLLLGEKPFNNEAQQWEDKTEENVFLAQLALDLLVCLNKPCACLSHIAIYCIPPTRRSLCDLRSAVGIKPGLLKTDGVRVKIQRSLPGKKEKLPLMLPWP